MTKSLRTFGSLVLVSASLFLSACTSIQTVQLSTSELVAWDEYQQQVAWIKSADSNANFTRLRESFSRTANYAPYSVRPVESAIVAYEKQQFEQCVGAAEQMLEKLYSHIQAHFLAMLCQRELGNQLAAELHDGVVRGLLASIDQSGDGESPASAMITYDMQELYTYLEFMGLTVISQALVNENNRWYDVMTVTYDDEAREFELYFDITRQFNRSHH